MSDSCEHSSTRIDESVEDRGPDRLYKRSKVCNDCGETLVVSVNVDAGHNN